MYAQQSITSPFPLKIGTTTLVFHSFGWQYWLLVYYGVILYLHHTLLTDLW